MDNGKMTMPFINPWPNEPVHLKKIGSQYIAFVDPSSNQVTQIQSYDDQPEGYMPVVIPAGFVSVRFPGQKFHIWEQQRTNPELSPEYEAKLDAAVANIKILDGGKLQGQIGEISGPVTTISAGQNKTAPPTPTTKPAIAHAVSVADSFQSISLDEAVTTKTLDQGILARFKALYSRYKSGAEELREDLRVIGGFLVKSNPDYKYALEDIKLDVLAAEVEEFSLE